MCLKCKSILHTPYFLWRYLAYICPLVTRARYYYDPLNHGLHMTGTWQLVAAWMLVLSLIIRYYRFSFVFYGWFYCWSSLGPMIWTILCAVIHDKFNLFHQNDGMDTHIQRRKCWLFYSFNSQSPTLVPIVPIDYIVRKTHFALLWKRVNTKAQTINHVAPCSVDFW